MNNHDYEHRPSFGDRLLERLSESMNRTLHYLWHHRRQDRDAEASKRLDEYGKACDGPARRMLDIVEHRAREGGPSWQEKPLPGLEPTPMEQGYMRLRTQVDADERRRRDAFERPGPGPITQRERRSIWAQDMGEAEKAALQVTATENTYDYTQGRER